MTHPKHRGDGRDRILKAAWQLVERGGPSTATLARIAETAGISRQAVYLLFGSRSALLVAMMVDHDRRTGTERSMIRASLRKPPERALCETIRIWFAYIGEIDSVIMAVQGAALSDPDAAEAWQQRMEDLYRFFRRIVERIDLTGGLAKGWTIDTAADFVWTQVHPVTWHNLVAERGWSVTKAANVTSSVLSRILLHGLHQMTA